MSMLHPASLARITALAAALALPAATAAIADDNAAHETLIMAQSASPAQKAPQRAENAAVKDEARSGSTFSTLGMTRDVLGAGGRQDELARKIYQPGQTVGFGG
jgi:hypothetical protein